MSLKHIPFKPIPSYISQILISSIFLTLLSINVFAQSVVNLSSPENGKKNHIASEQIIFSDGYSFTSSSSDWMKAYIDYKAINNNTPISNNNYESLKNVSLDESKSVGNISGEAFVDDLGGANYKINLNIPKSFNDLEPSIALSYNSRSGDGIMGRGWTLSGWSEIKLTHNTNFHNDKAMGVSGSSDDVFLFENQRLVPVNGENGKDLTEYKLESENFSKIKSFGNIKDLPKSFRIETKEGLEIIFGGSDDFYELFHDKYLQNPYHGEKPVKWLSKSVTDLNGNKIIYEYSNNSGQKVISKITYGNINDKFMNEIKFHYAKRERPYTSFYSGINKPTNIILEKITMSINGDLFRTYSFNYRKNIDYLLAEITETGSNSDELNSTKFKYGDQPEGFFNKNTGYSIGDIGELINLENSSHVHLITNDFNGDGITDIMVAYRRPERLQRFNTAKIFEGSSEGEFIFSRSIDLTQFNNRDMMLGLYNKYSPQENVHFSDFNGDGKGDFIVVEHSNFARNYQVYENEHIGRYSMKPYRRIEKINLYINNGYGFDLKEYSINQNINSVALDVGICLGDFNGDGATDIYLGLSNEHEREEDWQGNTIGNFNRQTESTFIFPANDEVIKKPGKILSDFTIVDMDGDGKDEFYILGYRYSVLFEPIFENGEFEFKQSRFMSGDDFFTKSWEKIGQGEGLVLRFNSLFKGDFNGDGLTDFLSFYHGKEKEEKNANISLSDGFFQQRLSETKKPSFLNQLTSLRNIRVADFNGDGKTDIVYFNSTGFKLYLSGGGNSFIYRGQFSIGNYDINSVSIGDFNGDGNMDVFALNKNGEPILCLINENSTEFLLEEVLDGLGNHTAFQYEFLGESITTETSVDKNYDNNVLKIKSGTHVVKSLSLPEGFAEITQSEYKYGNLLYHKTGNGYLGFDEITVKSEQANRLIKKNFSLNTNFYRFYLSEETTALLSNPSDKIEGVSYDFDFENLGQKRFWLKHKGTQVKDYVSNLEQVDELEYDGFGNVTYQKTTKKIEQSVKETLVKNTSFDKFGTWLPSHPIIETTTIKRINEEPYSRTIQYPSYDENGNLKKMIIDPNDNKSLTEEFSYNDYGQVLSQKISGQKTNGSEVSSIEIITEYDQKGRVKKEYNALGQFVEYEYDNLNRLAKKIDVNELETSYEYDGFGRKTKYILPSGVEVNTLYFWNILDMSFGNVSTVYGVRNFGDEIPEEITFYDGAYRTKKEVVVDDYRELRFTTKSYDEKGNIAYETVPSRENNIQLLSTNYTYDEFNRVIKEETDGITPITYEYSNTDKGTKVKKTDEMGITTKEYGINDELLSVTDSKGNKMEYNYYSNRKLKNTQLGNDIIAEIKYDLQGNKTELKDKNAGTITYSYNSFQQLVKQNDNGKEVGLSFDAFGRIKSLTRPEGVTNYNYYSSGKAINKIKNISSPDDMFVEYFYDSDLGRLIKLKETIDEEIMETQYEYNRAGQLSRMVYPSGFAIENEYNNYGRLRKVKKSDEDLNIWEHIRINGYGQHIDYKMGNGKRSYQTYDAYGLPNNYYTEDIMDMDFDYNLNTQNLDSRTNHINVLTEAFDYDDLDRLTGINVNDVNTFLTNYEDNGNIKTKTGVGNYTYDEEKINAVKQIKSPLEETSISLDMQNITYTSFNKLKTIEEGDYRLTYYYGHDKQRRKGVLKKNDEVVYTKYYHPSYEKIIDAFGEVTELSYINTPMGANAINIKINGGTTQNELLYVYKDYLGSPLVLTDEEGDVVYEQSFDAWGRRRNPNDWTYENIPETPSWLRGYTGHEHLPEFDLINMNGRMYDPITSTMLSPDNYVSDAENIQNFNRYSYVLNNPLKYTDPSGQTQIMAIPMMYGGYGPITNTYTGQGANRVTTYEYGKSGYYKSTHFVNNQHFYSTGYQAMASVNRGFTFAGRNYGSGQGIIAGYAGQMTPAGGGQGVRNRTNYQSGGKCPNCLNPSTVGNNFLGLSYPGGNNPKTYGGEYSYSHVPINLAEYPAIGHDRRYDNLNITGASGLLSDTRAIGADWRFVGEQMQIAVDLTINPVDRLTASALGVGLGIFTLPKTTYKVVTGGKMWLSDILIWYNISNQGVTNTPSDY